MIVGVVAAASYMFIYTEESEYIQAAKGEEHAISRGTISTANTPPITARSLVQSSSSSSPGFLPQLS